MADANARDTREIIGKAFDDEPRVGRFLSYQEEMQIEDRASDLATLATARFRRQLRLARSLGLLDELLEETTHQVL
jgi:hypothetical protein